MVSGLTQITGKAVRHASGSVTLSTPIFTFSLTPSAELFSIAKGEEITAAVRLIYREPTFELFGFATEKEAAFFDDLLKVPGVGPRSAMSVLSSAPLNVTMAAIKRGDSSVIDRAPGVGKKSAQKIVLELQDKLDFDGVEEGNDDADIMDALVSLGYTQSQAREAVKRVPKDIEKKEDRLREALRSLSQ